MKFNRPPWILVLKNSNIGWSWRGRNLYSLQLKANKGTLSSQTQASSILSQRTINYAISVLAIEFAQQTIQFISNIYVPGQPATWGIFLKPKQKEQYNNFNTHTTKNGMSRKDVFKNRQQTQHALPLFPTPKELCKMLKSCTVKWFHNDRPGTLFRKLLANLYSCFILPETLDSPSPVLPASTGSASPETPAEIVSSLLLLPASFARDWAWELCLPLSYGLPPENQMIVPSPPPKLLPLPWAGQEQKQCPGLTLQCPAIRQLIFALLIWWMPGLLIVRQTELYQCVDCCIRWDCFFHSL